MKPKQTALRRYQQAAYRRGLGFVLEAHDILAMVRAQGWTQHQVLNEVFLKLESAIENLGEVSPNDLARETRQRILKGVGDG